MSENQLRIERLRQKMTQFELGIKANIQPTDISKIENGYVIPYPSWKKRLAKALGVKEEYLFGEVTNNAE